MLVVFVLVLVVGATVDELVLNRGQLVTEGLHLVMVTVMVMVAVDVVVISAATAVAVVVVSAWAATAAMPVARRVRKLNCILTEVGSKSFFF